MEITTQTRCSICEEKVDIHELQDHLIDKHGTTYTQYTGMIDRNIQLVEKEIKK